MSDNPNQQQPTVSAFVPVDDGAVVVDETRESFREKRERWKFAWTLRIVRFIDWLAGQRRARAEARAKRRALARVISLWTPCRACGWKGERHLISGVWQTALKMEFVRIQPTAKDPATGAIKLECMRCGAWWHTPTVQPSAEWVEPMPVQRNPMVR